MYFCLKLFVFVAAILHVSLHSNTVLDSQNLSDLLLRHSVTQLCSKHPKNLKILEWNDVELHLKCTQKGAKRLRESMENYLASPFNYWWHGRIIQKGTAYLPQQCILWLTRGSWCQSILDSIDCTRKICTKIILLVEGEQRKLIYTILGVHDKFLSSLASIKY